MSDCIFCEPGNPCHAHMAAPPKKRAAKPRKAAPVAVEPVPVAPAVVGADPWAAVVKAPTFKPVERVEMTQDELAFREAVRNLYPILAPSERKRYKDIVDPIKSAAEYKRSVEVRGMFQ